MLRCDRYLPVGSHAIDLATGATVSIRSGCSSRPPAALFETRKAQTLIDIEERASRRIEVWEASRSAWPAPQEDQWSLVLAEMLDVARQGAPRVLDLGEIAGRADDRLARVLARVARVRGWIPIALDVLAPLARTNRRRVLRWLSGRSLVLFVRHPVAAGDALDALIRLARADAHPHVLVLHRLPGKAEARSGAPGGPRFHPASLAAPRGGMPSLEDETTARWAWVIDRLASSEARHEAAVALATVLAARQQWFEARALLTTLDESDDAAKALLTTIDEDARRRAIQKLNVVEPALQAGGWVMVDAFVDVLRLCQDIEDEQLALARVGALLKDRLGASSVAFVARDGSGARVLARVGSESAGADIAVRAMNGGAPIAAAAAEGPAESACPVRHAAEVIGAVWCRWSAGTPVAAQDAAALLGVAAAATAPSMRLAIARSAPARITLSAVPELVGDSEAMCSVRDAIVRAASSPFSVVIEGESGSGKELAARAIHLRSPRQQRRFCAINCAALVDELVEADLFGHVRGAFTGATTDRPGVFEEANGGTLFLDEVAELGLRVQAKLLRALQEGEVRRLGESAVRRVDVRFVAATNRPLAREVAAGRFRADLWYRLDVIRITMPPLRDRLEDLSALVTHLWRALAARTGSRALLSSSCVAALSGYDWPGNIRELQNVLASMLVATPRAGLIGPGALPPHVARVAALERGWTLATARRQFEERYVRAALARAGGRTAVAARQLGLSRQGLTKLISRLGIAESPGPDRSSTRYVQ
ncbi:MAG: sigma-54 interaction domain-containing protein [Acidobacteriota bacterium]